MGLEPLQLFIGELVDRGFGLATQLGEGELLELGDLIAAQSVTITAVLLVGFAGGLLLNAARPVSRLGRNENRTEEQE